MKNKLMRVLAFVVLISLETTTSACRNLFDVSYGPWKSSEKWTRGELANAQADSIHR
jgi:hypothetical protein